MIDDKQKNLLRSILIESTPVLFLGAGFSIGATSKSALLDATKLKDLICETLAKPKVSTSDYDELKEFDLMEICEQVYSLYGRKDELYELLIDCFKNTIVPDDDYHMKLTSYPWKHIYTVNIDDLLEYIYTTQNKPFHVQNKTWLEEEPVLDCTSIFKLHGCVNNPSNGFIFSRKEYTELISKKLDPKLSKLSDEIINQNVIFVGTQLNELDIEYYLQVYEDAGMKYRTNKLIFVEPYPNLKLKRRIKDLGAELIEATTEEFLEFVSSLNYNPLDIQKSIYSLSYAKVFRLSDIEENTFVSPYESKLFTGEFCNWQDAADKWIVNTTAYKNAVVALDKMISAHHDVSCFSLYGSVYSGKSCILKNIGYYLALNGFDVLDYQGNHFDSKAIWKYIEISASTKFAIIIDSAAYYYQQIESCFGRGVGGKQIVFITASRTYYHKRKKYFLEGNPFCEFEITPDFSSNDSLYISRKLEEKSFLAFLASLSSKDRINEVAKTKNMVNLILKLTYGKVPKRIEREYSESISFFSLEEKRLLLELAIFDSLDIEFYPRELFIERYGNRVNLSSSISKGKIDVVDLVRSDSNGLALRNALVKRIVLKAEKHKIVSVMQELLKCISRRVSETNSDNWSYIFQRLLAQRRLSQELCLSSKETEKIFLAVKEDYKDISYYWLQLGLLKQDNGEYKMAFNYLEMSSSIRPESYQIQHAIARNYFRYANDNNDIVEAKEAFSSGERMMRALIDSDKKYIEKARPFSVSTYITEKIKFLNKFDVVPTNNELRYMISALEKIFDKNDDYSISVKRQLCKYLKKIDKLNLMKLDFDTLSQIMKEDVSPACDMVDDFL